jgi:hypothetical protein
MKRFLKSLLILCVAIPLLTSLASAADMKLHKFVIGSAGTVGAKNGDGLSLYSTVGQLAAEKRSANVSGPKADLYQGFWALPDAGTSVECTDCPPTGAILSNYPNPFNGNTTIRYSLPSAANVRFRIYDIMGNEINEIEYNWQDIGNHEIQFGAKDRSGKDLSSGSYMYELIVSGNGSQPYTLRNVMVLVK